MARKLWSQRVGEQKTVEGYVFTIVDNEGQKVIIDALGEKFSICRSTWNDGKFTKILRGLKPKASKYLGQTKMINDVLFTIVEVVKNKAKVVAEGFEGTKEMAIQTWKNGRFFKNMMKVLKRIVEKKYELVVYDEFQRDFLGRVVKERGNEINLEFGMCDTVAEVRKLFKQYSKYLHPDMGNTMIADKYGWEWLCALKEATIAQIEFWYDDDDEE